MSTAFSGFENAVDTSCQYFSIWFMDTRSSTSALVNGFLVRRKAFFIPGVPNMHDNRHALSIFAAHRICRVCVCVCVCVRVCERE